MSGADHHVIATLDDIDQMVTEFHIQFNLRIRQHEPAQRRNHEHPDKRQTHPQLAPRRALRLREFKLDLLHLRKDPTAAFKEELAFLSQRDATGASMKEADAEARFKPGDGLAYRR